MKKETIKELIDTLGNKRRGLPPDLFKEYSMFLGMFLSSRNPPTIKQVLMFIDRKQKQLSTAEHHKEHYRFNHRFWNDVKDIIIRFYTMKEDDIGR